ncbi:hypothetical protein [Emticicia oligotrophica]|nr:hypothetical protein [Emticicia oligotrophica]
MLALENYGVAELSDTEMIGIDGGDFWDNVVRVLGYTVAGAAICLMVWGAIVTFSGDVGGNGGGPSPTGPGIL